MNERIYIADDEAAICELMRNFLDSAGYRTTCFHDGLSVLKAAERDAPDLVILDIMMPGLSGLDVCAALRKKSAVPIIMVSAKDTPLDRIEGITLGGDDYLVKPFLPLELVARVRALFRRIELIRGAQGPENLLSFGICGCIPACVPPRLTASRLRSRPRSLTSWPTWCATAIRLPGGKSCCANCGSLKTTCPTRGRRTISSSACAKSWRHRGAACGSRQCGAMDSGCRWKEGSRVKITVRKAFLIPSVLLLVLLPLLTYLIFNEMAGTYVNSIADDQISGLLAVIEPSIREAFPAQGSDDASVQTAPAQARVFLSGLHKLLKAPRCCCSACTRRLP